MTSGNVDFCKYSMFFINFLGFLGGIALLGVGIWAVTGSHSFSLVVVNHGVAFNAFYIIVAVGCFLILVGFLGCCGAVREDKCMLGTFFFLILVIFLLEIVAGILAFVYYPRTKQAAVDSMKHYNDNTKTARDIREGWIALQKAFNCCGINGYFDWAAAGIVDPPPPCSVNTRGCEKALQSYFWVLGGIAIGVLVIEILAMTFACCIFNNVKREKLN